MIQINPLQSYIDGGPRAAITSPPSASLVFDLPGKSTWVKGVKLKGTDHTYTFSHDNYINLTNTPGSDEAEDIQIGININTLQRTLNSKWNIEVNKAGFNLTTTWQDSGVDLSSLSIGVCLLNINYQNVYYSGTFSYAGQGINTDDEIILHQSGTITSGRGRVFAKIAAVNGVTKLLLVGTVAETNISLFNIKIKQIAIV